VNGLPLWEYKVVSVIDHLVGAPAEDVLNQLGSEGWELTGIDTTFPAFPRYVFKRPLVNSFRPEPELDPDQDRFLRNTAMAEALMMMPDETRDALLNAILTDDEKGSPTPPDDFYERVQLYFASQQEQSGAPEQG
jgi:hypothetical protein